MENRVGSPYPPRCLAPKVLTLRGEDPSVLQTVIHRNQSRACQEALLGQLRSLLHVIRFSGNRRWRKVRVFVRNLLSVFTCLISCSAQRFRNSCEKAGKGIMVWTVNEVEHMMEVCLFLSDVIRQMGSLKLLRPPVNFIQKRPYDGE